MEGEAGEFLDWEVLNNSDDAGQVNSLDAALVDSSESDETPGNFDGAEGESEGMIRSDHFSLENRERLSKPAAGDDVSEGADSVESDNPSWVDPGSETRYVGRNAAEFWSDTSSDRSDERKFSEFDAKHELSLSETAKSHVGSEGVEEMKARSKNWGQLGLDETKLSDFDVKHELASAENAKTEVGFENLGEIETQDKDSSKFWSDSGGDALVSMEYGIDYAQQRDGSEKLSDLDSGNGSNENKADAVGEVKSDTNSGGDGERRRVIWWKVPLEVLRYCVLRVGPVWSFSMAAAVMGLVILGRRLYKMKRKSQSLQLKVTVDDKKVSQFMSRAARLNEAFSVVRRVPIIRPSLPAPGASPWPAMTLR